MDSSTQNVSPLRLRMIEDMRMRKLAPKTENRPRKRGGSSLSTARVKVGLEGTLGEKDN